MSTRNETPTPRRRGRVRSLESREAILDAALELVQADGYAALTIEGIAARAGAGKQTIYRWWPSKAAVVLDALNAAAAADVPMPDTGRLATDLRVWLRSTFSAGRREPYVSVLPALMAAAQLDPAFGESFRSSFLEARRQTLRELLDRATLRGESPPTVPLDTLIDIVFGVLWYRLLSTHARPDDRLADELTELLVQHPG
jgi:AcrR family transcriptional regulator